MKSILLSIMLVLGVVGCQSKGDPHTAFLLGQVKTNLVDAQVALNKATTSVNDGLGLVKDTEAAVKIDNKTIAATQRELQGLKDSVWVKTALFLRKWAIIISVSYVVLGLTSGVLLGRGVAVKAATFVLNELPLATIFKVIGRLFAKKS